ncbi:hypothetical protein Deipe_3310 [Deinococcus peraridilitoris DSM 19664]|uniref:Uncharacterized protein n=1 Tax=Deinococcus peraridilitoris (strain DSM 19664 / LMG 22246 / CIP 109416 / KR-200) TaxID=937777 RepID=L0A4H9_DEIPD|nr:hypothetical protein Deipe_3310 [Deinococcus peraridilitoris DSM 19664]
MLSAAFFLTVGGVLYFMPSAGLLGLTVTPVWVARFTGAVIAAWGLQLALSASRPSGRSIAGLATGNLLVSATLVPAALAGITAVSGIPAVLPLGVGAGLVVLAVLAIVLPRERSRL